MRPQPGSIRIEPAAIEDWQTLSELEALAFAADRISARSWRALLASASATVIVARRALDDETRVVGATVLLRRAGTSVARLYSIAVAPSARGQGVAASLLVDAERRVRDAGAAVLRLETRVDNLAAQRVFVRDGFVAHGLRAAYYEDGADALLYRKTLRRLGAADKSLDLASDHLIVVEKTADFRWAGSDSRVMTAEEFISERAQEHDGAAAASSRRPRKVINLCRNYDYLSLGYYCSLLAEARGDRVTPGVETILDLQQRSTQQGLLAQLDRLIDGLDDVPRSVNTLSFHVFFGRIEDPALADLARKSFELFRCPLLELELERPAGLNGWKTSSVKALDPRDVDASRDALFIGALDEFTRRRWSPARVHSVPKMDLAILHDPGDPLPPSNLATLARIAEVGEDMGVAVELIRKKDFSRLTQFDALFIRETTAVAHHTFKFAKKAQAEGMPVIDDPGSILRCTNKAFLAELLRENGIGTPRTRLVSRRTLARFEDSLDYPVVLKVPDGSFSREVKKAGDFRQFQAIAQSMFKESEIVLVQDFMYTEFDWRVGVLDGEPLFVARYFMVRDHWQIIQHAGDGQHAEGRTEAVRICDTPPDVLRAATAAARLIGDGFYGVDLKQNAAGVFVIEINDNPNLDVGAEDKVLGDEVYRRLLGHLLAKFESRAAGAAPPAVAVDKALTLAVAPRPPLEAVALHARAMRAGR